jgi:hypothetical protein
VLTSFSYDGKYFTKTVAAADGARKRKSSDKTKSKKENRTAG